MSRQHEPVAIIGAGKMGLPIACHLAGRGLRVEACDIDSALVATINRGECPFDEPGLAELLARVRRENRLEATTQTAEAIRRAGTVIVLVPVLVTADKRAELNAIEAVTFLIGENIQPGALVCYETTLPVGTTRRLAVTLEAGGLRAGTNFHVAFSPERVKSRHVLERLGLTPKVVGGLTPECASVATEFYEQGLGAPVINAGTLEAAEFTKLADMIYRDVNIGLANELARYAEVLGVDFDSVRQAANTSGEAAILSPGIGVGGHCTPVYPWFAIRDAEQRGLALPMATLGRTVNDGQAQWTLDRLEAAWKPLAGQTVLILGLGFRPGVKEHVCSPAFLLRGELLRRGARVLLHDPLYSAEEIRAHGFEPADAPGTSGAKALVLNTAHAEYAELKFDALARTGVEAVLDGRNLWSAQTVRGAGLVYVGIGRA
ncbi:MAG: hypothetical protein PWP23_2203 [Candidatus Sumerlaeota bacterium]|nr:hypothetical protein [Candidatus Sumerlaeota bacterium]